MENDSPWRIAILSVAAGLMGSLIGAGAGYLGARQSIDAQSDQQARQFEESRALDAASRRAEVYTAFLDAANEYAAAVTYVSAWFIDCDGELTCIEDTIEPDALVRVRSARFEYQGAVNDLYIYGSDEAVASGQSVSATMPPSLGFTELDLHPVLVEFTDRYNDFLAVMCEEVPPRPREGC